MGKEVEKWREQSVLHEAEPKQQVGPQYDI